MIDTPLRTKYVSMWLRRFACALSLAVPLLMLPAARAAAQAASLPAARNGTAAAHGLVYNLPPAKLRQARSLYHWRTALDFADPLWDIVVLLAILNFRWAAGFRDWAASVSRRKWLQGFCFIPLILLLIALLELPLSAAAHQVSLAYGQSIQHWGSWFLDRGKELLLDLVSGTLIVSVLFALIRVSPKRWWIWIWMLSLPAQILVVFILPVVVDPLFNQFEPLSKSDPALVRQLERVVARTGEDIPPSRMFLMRASEKVTGSNAYVTGFGSSKRVVVWDTTIKSSPTGEILVIFGHELGHYVLNHIRRGLVIGSILSFFLLWIGFHLLRLLVRRWGARWRIASLEDWGSVVVVLLVFSLLSFLAEPIGNAISRAQEHQADVFGEEVVHGIVADPEGVAAASFQRLGEQSLDYPDPNPFVVFWTYDHPTTAAREAFAASYDPWQPGKQPRYFTRNGQLLPHGIFGF